MYFGLKTKIICFGPFILNSLEKVWREETIKELKKKQQTDEVVYRLQYEENMLNYAKEHRYSNNFKDIVKKMEENKWY